MNPFDVCFTGFVTRLYYQRLPDPTTAVVRVYGGIKNKGMNSPIPSEVDKANQVYAIADTYIRQTVL